MKGLEKLAAACALLVAGMTLCSVIGRNLFASPVRGDVELSQLGIALAIALCLPWCQLKRGLRRAGAGAGADGCHRHRAGGQAMTVGLIVFGLMLAVWPLLAIFVVVFGGIYGGLVSPTEGASIGALATLASGLLSGELRGEGLKRALLGTAETSAMVFMIFLGADMMNSALALTQMPAQLAQWVGGLPVVPLVIVAVVLAFYVVLGCVMDELSMLLLTIPVIFPTIMGLDLWGLAAEPKAIWFGILVLMTVGIGMLAPPVGLNVYVVNGMAREVPMNETYKGVLPFLASDALRLLLLLFVPAVSVGVLRWL